LKKLKSISVGSVFRISLILGAVIGFLVGFGYMIYDFFNRDFLEGILFLFLWPLLYCALLGFGNALVAWIYNRVAERLGGIEVEFE
jgi:hypothetical protein